MSEIEIAPNVVLRGNWLVHLEYQVAADLGIVTGVARKPSGDDTEELVLFYAQDKAIAALPMSFEAALYIVLMVQGHEVVANNTPAAPSSPRIGSGRTSDEHPPAGLPCLGRWGLLWASFSYDYADEYVIDRYNDIEVFDTSTPPDEWWIIPG